jgi:hypothetical protein
VTPGLHPPHHLRRDVLQRGRAELLHRDAGLEAQDAKMCSVRGLRDPKRLAGFGLSIYPFGELLLTRRVIVSAAQQYR